MEIVEPRPQLPENGHLPLDLVDANLRLRDKTPEFLDAGIVIGCAFRTGRGRKLIERLIEVGKQVLDVVTQRTELGILSIELRDAVFKPPLVVNELLHALAEISFGRSLKRIDLGRQAVARLAKVLDAGCDTGLRCRKRSKACVQLRVDIRQTGDRFRSALDLIAASVAVFDEFHQFFQTNVKMNRVVTACDLRQRPLDIGLAVVNVGEKLLDRPPFLEHRNEPLLQRLLLGADLVDAGLQIADLVAALLDLREALRFGKPMLHSADSVFRDRCGQDDTRPLRHRPATSPCP